MSKINRMKMLKIQTEFRQMAPVTRPIRLRRRHTVKCSVNNLLDDLNAASIISRTVFIQVFLKINYINKPH